MTVYVMVATNGNHCSSERSMQSRFVLLMCVAPALCRLLACLLACTYLQAPFRGILGRRHQTASRIALIKRSLGSHEPWTKLL